MRPLRVVLADDEPLAREVVRDLLAADPEVELVAEARDGNEALTTIRAVRPDLALLDIEMPGRGGLQVAAELASDPEAPAIVFVTAFNSYATGAFDVSALDYVVKPFSDERFTIALTRAKRRVRESRLGDLALQVARAAEELDRQRPAADRISLQVGDRSLLLRTEDIVWIQAEDYYCRVHAKNGSHLVRASVASFEERLGGRFLRVHRAALVNLDEVVAVERLTRGAKLLVLSNGSRCRIARSRLAEVERVLSIG
ncbi:MAG: LytTR family DNA-binding domain-containing protein [Thermoanaerobaculia bacterium]